MVCSLPQSAVYNGLQFTMVFGQQQSLVYHDLQSTTVCRPQQSPIYRGLPWSAVYKGLWSASVCSLQWSLVHNCLLSHSAVHQKTHTCLRTCLRSTVFYRVLYAGPPQLPIVFRPSIVCNSLQVSAIIYSRSQQSLQRAMIRSLPQTVTVIQGLQSTVYSLHTTVCCL